MVVLVCEEWWSATNDALAVKQSFPGLGRYLDNKYKPINGAKFPNFSDQIWRFVL